MLKKPNLKLGIPATFQSVERTDTHAESCVVSGDGLKVAMIGEMASFRIEARDENDVRRKSGGDHFFVFVRGPAKVRAKVTDNKDGSYGVQWRTYTSGQFYLSVTLLGVNLPGSPFPVYAFHPTPHAPNCEALGDALTHAVARTSTAFELVFRDKLGHDLGAVTTDIDVFTEPVTLAERPNAPEPDGSRPSSPQSTGRWSPTLSSRSTARSTARSASLLTPNSADLFPDSSRDGKSLSTWRSLGLSSTRSRRKSARARLQGAPSKADKLKATSLLLPVHRREQIERTPSSRAARQLQSPLEDAYETTSSKRTTRKNPFLPKAKCPQPPDSARLRLAPEKRQQYTQMWSRRATIDKEHLQVKDDRGVAISRACGGLEKSIYSHELEVDPTGFAFGGLKTEKVRVRGRGYGNWETRTIHRVYYSIGLAGSYLLHVRLRREGLPVPGSPFQLNVVPGVAVAHASFLTTEAEPIGTRKLGILLQTCDVMGNACVAGGADVTCSSPGPEDLRCVVRDNRDGTYKLEWRASRRFCAIEVRVGGLHVVGSPLMFGGEDVSPTNSPPVSSRSQEPNLHTSRRMDIGLGGFRLPAMAAYVPAALDEDPFEYLRDDDEAAAAATMIGARVRGQQGRKRSQAKAAIASIPTDPEAQKAASKVQAMQRGKNTRKKQQKKAAAAAAAAAVPLPAEADRPQTPKRLKPQAKRAVAVAAPIQAPRAAAAFAPPVHAPAPEPPNAIVSFCATLADKVKGCLSPPPPAAAHKEWWETPDPSPNPARRPAGGLEMAFGR